MLKKIWVFYLCLGAALFARGAAAIPSFRVNDFGPSPSDIPSDSMYGVVLRYILEHADVAGPVMLLALFACWLWSVLRLTDALGKLLVKMFNK